MSSSSFHPTVTFLIGSVTSGGLSKYCLRLARAFQEKGCQVRILTAVCSLPTLPVEVVCMGSQCKLSLVQLLCFDAWCSKQLKRQPADVVFGFERNFCSQTHYRAGNGVHAAYLHHRSKKESLFKRMSFWINPLHRLILSMEKSTFQGQSLKILFVNSHFIKKEVIQYYPRLDPLKVHVVHNGVEWYPLQNTFDASLERKEQIALSVGLDPQYFHFLFIGHEYGRKGLDILLKAFSRLSCMDLCRLVVIGKDKAAPQFKRLAAELGIHEKVHFLGARSDTYSFYQVCDTLVIPTLYDPFANVTVEALAMGLSVISSSHNGGAEVLSEKTGWVFADPLSIEQLHDCLEKAALRPKTAQNAHIIRSSVQGLDFSHQLDLIVAKTLSSIDSYCQ